MPHKYGKSTPQGEKKISVNPQDLAILRGCFSITIIPLVLVGYEIILANEARGAE